VVIFAWHRLALASMAAARGGWRAVAFLTLSGWDGLSWLCYFRRAAAGPASRVASAGQAERVLGDGVCCGVLGEKLSPLAMVGGLMISGGAVDVVLA